MRQITPRALFLGALFVCFTASAAAQSPPPLLTNVDPSGVNTTVASGGSSNHSPEMEEIRRQLRDQREEIERLRAMLGEQTRLLTELHARVERAEQTAPSIQSKDTLPAMRDMVAIATAPSLPLPSAPNSGHADQVEERLARAEAQIKKTTDSLARQLGSMTFSGDIRLRYESFYGQLNALPNSDNPTVIGNPLTTRQRLRARGRLAIRGQIGKEFDWGIRFATGSFPDVTSTNQTLTDFFSHKTFALDQLFMTYKPAAVPGFQVQAGKFEPPWLRTEMTLDTDIQTEGLNQTYTRDFKDSPLKNLTFVAWQLPFLERLSGFVLDSDGTVSQDRSRRAGRDLALYGAQLRGRFELTPKVALTLSAADLYFSGTQLITPIQFLGAQVQFPVTVTVPATGTTPARSVTGQVTIPREQLVNGSGNLGISTASNNATNSDGGLSSGFNLVDLIGRLDFAYSKRFPVALLFNFVTNTQTRDVVVADLGGVNRLLRNNENNGYWAEFQVGSTRERGDVFLGYTFIRIEKDAVLTPFNYSDLAQQSDVRAQRFVFSYAVDPRVTLSLTGIISQRPNGLLGVFGATPSGSLNRPTTRLQFDTLFRF